MMRARGRGGNEGRERRTRGTRGRAGGRGLEDGRDGGEATDSVAAREAPRLASRAERCRVPTPPRGQLPKPNPALSLSLVDLQRQTITPREIGPADVIIASSILGDLDRHIGPQP